MKSNVLASAKVRHIATWLCVVTTCALGACNKPGASSDGGPTGARPASSIGDGSAGASSSAQPSAPAEPKTPLDLFHEYQQTVVAAADEERYADVCKSLPWFPPAICQWVAFRAQGKSVDRPDSELYRGLFNREHWVHAWGTVIDKAGSNGDYEASVNGYRNHVILNTEDTKFKTFGRFDMWVQEEPETQEVSVNSGATANWAVLDEMPLAKSLMSLAHSGVNVESTGIAKDAMRSIASYVPYSVLKGKVPSLPGATQPSASASTPVATKTTAPAGPAGSPGAAPTGSGPPTVNFDSLPRAAPVSAGGR